MSRELVERFYAAAASGDTETFLGSVADDIVVHEPAFLPYGGVYRGRDGFVAMLGEAAKMADVGSLVVDHIVAEGQRAFAVLRLRLLDGGEIHVAEESVIRDGLIAELRIFVHDAGTVVPQP